MKRKLLFVIPSLELGGAEKSLINLLKELDPRKYEIDLFLFYKQGFFLNTLPSYVNVINNDSQKFSMFSQSLLKSLFVFGKEKDFKAMWHRVLFALNNKFTKNAACAEQKAWCYVKGFYPNLSQEYDVAIGYLEKSTHYFIVDNVKAKRKVGWIHTDLLTLGLDTHFEEKYLQKLDDVVFVSKIHEARLAQVIPSIKNKVVTVENIISATAIAELAAAPTSFTFDKEQFNIIFVGRLVKEKGLFQALDALEILHKKGYNFMFYLVGTGVLEHDLKRYAEEKRIFDKISFLGAMSNPYQLMKQADLFLMTSFYEGKSIALEEAKILNLPIVVTNFKSAIDQVENGVSGLIAEMSPVSIAEQIERLINDIPLRRRMREYLSGTQNLNSEKTLHQVSTLLL